MSLALDIGIEEDDRQADLLTQRLQVRFGPLVLSSLGDQGQRAERLDGGPGPDDGIATLGWPTATTGPR